MISVKNTKNKAQKRKHRATIFSTTEHEKIKATTKTKVRN